MHEFQFDTDMGDLFSFMMKDFMDPVSLAINGLSSKDSGYINMEDREDRGSRFSSFS